MAAGLLTFVAIAQGPSPTPGSAVWFDELAGVEPLAAEAEEELVRYLAAAALATSSGELPASLAADRAPRIFFLSLSDGVTAARVVSAAGRGAAEAAGRLRKEVTTLMDDGFVPRWIKVDLVREVHRREQVDPKKPLGLERSLYGLAFERDVALAFLAEELVAYTLVNSDQLLRLKNVRKRPRAAGARGRLDRLAGSAALSFYRFSASSYFADGREVVPLYRGHRRHGEPGPEELLRHAELGGSYLMRSVEANGRFVYSFLPKTNEAKEKYNALRHAGTLYSMLELYEVTGDRGLLAAAERALGYLRKELLTRCRVAEAETACIVDEGEVKLGGNALAIIALAKHAAVTGERRHLRLIDELGRWIVLTQGEDGEFKIHKQLQPAGEVSDFVSGYYPGEALLALVRRPDPDPDWLDAAERGARWLINVRDRKVSTVELDHDHWLLYALNELYRLRPDPLYLKHASRITEAILGRQRQGDPRFPDWLGSYYTPPRSTPTATRSEGLGAAYLLARDFGSAQEAVALLEALRLGVGFQLRTQFLPETAFYVRDPARTLGGFRRSLTNFEIRIDYVQHNISALLMLRRILLEAESPEGTKSSYSVSGSPTTFLATSPRTLFSPPPLASLASSDAALRFWRSPEESPERTSFKSPVKLERPSR